MISEPSVPVVSKPKSNEENKQSNARHSHSRLRRSRGHAVGRTPHADSRRRGRFACASRLPALIFWMCKSGAANLWGRLSTAVRVTTSLIFRQPWAARESGSWKNLVPRSSNVRVGDRVVFVGDSYATHALAPAAWLIPVPDGISPEASSGGYEPGISGLRIHAFCLSRETGRLVPDSGSGWRHWTLALPNGKDSRGTSDWGYVDDGEGQVCSRGRRGRGHRFHAV